MERYFEKLAILSFFVVPVMLSVFDLANLDFGFHLKAGEYIWLERAIPRHDMFSYLAEGNRWVDSHWLFQLILYGVYSLGGVPGAILLRVAILLGAFALSFATFNRRESLCISIPIGLLVVFTSSHRFLVRPELVSFLFLAGYFFALTRFSVRPRLVLVAIPMAQAVWANMHGLHAIGVAFVGAFLLGETIQFFAHRRLDWLPNADTSLPDLRRKALLLLLTCLASLANANGMDGILYPFQIFHELQNGVVWFPSLGELRSPFAFGPGHSIVSFLLPYRILLIVSVLGFLSNLRAIRLSHLLPYLGFLYLSILGERNIALFAFVAGPITVYNFGSVVDRLLTRSRKPRERRRQLTGAVALASAVMTIGLSAATITGDLHAALGHRWRFGLGEAELVPGEVVEYLRQSEGRFFNSPRFGGYLIWKLYPEKQVALDGRWEVYGEALQGYMDVFRDPAALSALAGEYDASTLVLHRSVRPGRGIAAGLLRTGEWELVMTHPQLVVLEREPIEQIP